jgi:hypothetical protein
MSVDAEIWPTCQKWLIIDVLGQLKSLTVPWKLHAEVKRGAQTFIMEVKRSAVWDVNIGQTAQYKDLPNVYN